MFVRYVRASFPRSFFACEPSIPVVVRMGKEKNLASQMYPGCRVCRTLEELLADEAVELVIVNTPNYTF